MPKFVYSRDGGYLKIFVDNDADPDTVPDDAYEEFRFNSLTNKIGYVENIFAFYSNDPDWTFGGSPSYQEHYIPTGSNFSTCDIMIGCNRMSSGTRVMYVTFFPERINGDRGPGNWVPWWEYRVKRNDSGRWPGPRVQWSQDEDGSLVVGNWRGFASIVSSQVSPRDTDVFDHSDVDEMVTGYAQEIGAHFDLLMTVWDMPMNEAALVDPSDTPVPGQTVLIMSPSIIKIARPGFDVGTATDRELVLSSERVPAKIVRAGEVVIPGSSFVDVTSPIPLSDFTTLDYHAKRDTDNRLYHPPQLDASSFGDTDKIDFEYEFFTDYVRFYNNDGHDLYVRYMLLTDDGSEPTAGGENILYRDNDGIQDFIQIKKPGSSDVAPSTSDILLDSRFAYLPMVAEGYIHWDEFTDSPDNTKMGETAKIINFENNGFKPFLKFSVVYNTDTGGFTKAKHPQTRLLYTSPGSVVNNRQAREGTPARITDTYVKFHMARDNPTFLQAIDGNIVATNGEKPQGIRYYIFAIPAEL